MDKTNTTVDTGNMAHLMEIFARVVGSDCDGENPGDYRNEDGLLICGTCGEPKEAIRNIPIIGERKTRRGCRCQRERFEREDAEREARKRQQEQVERANYCLHFCRTDERFQLSTLDRFESRPENARYLRLARNYVERFDEFKAKNKGLLLWGEPSSGKTFIASCIANALIQRQIPVIVTTMADFAPDAGFATKENEEYQALMAAIGKPDLLVIDDLGSERDSSYKAEQVYKGINRRYESRKPTIITTNLTIGQMQSETDMKRRRIYERVFEMCHPVEVRGINWRWDNAEHDYDEIEKILYGR